MLANFFRMPCDSKADCARLAIVYSEQKGYPFLQGSDHQSLECAEAMPAHSIASMFCHLLGMARRRTEPIRVYDYQWNTVISSYLGSLQSDGHIYDAQRRACANVEVVMEHGKKNRDDNTRGAQDTPYLTNCYERFYRYIPIRYNGRHIAGIGQTGDAIATAVGRHGRDEVKSFVTRCACKRKSQRNFLFCWTNFCGAMNVFRTTYDNDIILSLAVNKVSDDQRNVGESERRRITSQMFTVLWEQAEIAEAFEAEGDDYCDDFTIDQFLNSDRRQQLAMQQLEQVVEQQMGDEKSDEELEDEHAPSNTASDSNRSILDGIGMGGDEDDGDLEDVLATERARDTMICNRTIADTFVADAGPITSAAVEECSINGLLTFFADALLVPVVARRRNEVGNFTSGARLHERRGPSIRDRNENHENAQFHWQLPGDVRERDGTLGYTDMVPNARKSGSVIQSYAHGKDLEFDVLLGIPTTRRITRPCAHGGTTMSMAVKLLSTKAKDIQAAIAQLWPFGTYYTPWDTKISNWEAVVAFAVKHLG